MPLPDQTLSAAEIAQSLNEPDNQPQLNEEEREWLRRAMQPGTPFYKIVEAYLDGGRKIRDAIAQADLSRPEGIESARRLQAEAKARVDFTSYLLSFAQPQRPNPRQEQSQ